MEAKVNVNVAADSFTCVPQIAEYPTAMIHINIFMQVKHRALYYASCYIKTHGSGSSYAW